MLLAYLSNTSEIQLKYSFCIAPRFCKPAPLKYWVLQVEVFMDTEHSAEHKLHWKHPMASGTQAVALLPAAACGPLPRLYRTLQVPDLHHPARSHLECTHRSVWDLAVCLRADLCGSLSPARGHSPCSVCAWLWHCRSLLRLQPWGQVFPGVPSCSQNSKSQLII